MCAKALKSCPTRKKGEKTSSCRRKAGINDIDRRHVVHHAGFLWTAQLNVSKTVPISLRKVAMLSRSAGKVYTWYALRYANGANVDRLVRKEKRGLGVDVAKPTGERGLHLWCILCVPHGACDRHLGARYVLPTEPPAMFQLRAFEVTFSPLFRAG